MVAVVIHGEEPLEEEEATKEERNEVWFRLDRQLVQTPVIS